MTSLRISVLVLTLVSAGSALAAAPSMRELPRTDAFRTVADAMESRLADEVISTGTFDMAAVEVVGQATTTSAELTKMHAAIATAKAQELADKVPTGLAASTTNAKFTGTAVKTAGRRFSAVYAYAPESGEAEKKARTLWVLVHKAGITEKNGRVLTARARYHDPSTGTKKYFTHTLFLNTQTGRGLALSMVSGTM